MYNGSREPKVVVGLPRVLICKRVKNTKLQKNEILGGHKIVINGPILGSKSDNSGGITEESTVLEGLG